MARGMFVLPLIMAMAVLGFSPMASAQTTPEQSAQIWSELKPEIFGNKPIQDGAGIVSLIAPKRAEDAGLVPVDITITPSTATGDITAVTLVIDVNPSPLAAKFTLGKEAGVTAISTRVRVNDYSLMRVVAETEQGGLYMTQTYIKASGGCAAPATKNPEEAKATLGVMKLKQFEPQQPAASHARELQIMIRHPNNSGFQMDQVTMNYIPPHFVNELVITQDDQDVLKVESGISISENPNIRFNYVPRGNGEIKAVAKDNEGQVFKDHWPLENPGVN